MLTKVNGKWTENSVSQFMTELIDYAGLFPPAALPLTEAIRNYHTYIHGSDSWMIGSFVIPASKLNELEPFRSQFTSQHPLRLSVILSNPEEYDKDMEAVHLFFKTYQSVATIKAFEVPLPSQFDFALLEKRLTTQTASNQIYFEIAVTADQLAATLDSIQLLNQTSDKRFGLKMRMGGLTSNLFPSADQVAFVIHEAQKRGLMVKYTAGLHHPVRQYRKEVGTVMHGFINVFAASIMAYSCSVKKETIQAILLDEDFKNFSFTSDTLSWRHLTVSSSEINKTRSFFASSYGSCSFDEPREEMGELMIFNGEAAK